MKRVRSKFGFSFLELLVVMTIIGIMTSFAYFRFGPAFSRAKVRGAANVIATDLQSAQMLAARQGVPIVAAFDTANRTYELRTRAGDTTFVSRNLGEGSDYEVGSLAATNASIEFFPAGFTSGTATFTVDIDGYARVVTLSRAGMIRVRRDP